MGPDNTYINLKVARFSVYTIEIPMRFAVRHTLAERKSARNIIVCACGENGLRGWGECCPRPYVTGETVQSVISDLANIILPPMTGMKFSSMEEIREYLFFSIKGLGKNRNAAFCSVELALLDLAGKTFAKSAGSILGCVMRKKVRYSGVIAAGSPEKVKKHAKLVRLFGFKQVKVKVRKTLAENLAILRSARDVLGNKISLRIDANCAWDRDEAVRQIRAMEKFALEGVEQPVMADDIDGMKYVTSRVDIPIVADETLCSLKDADSLIDQKACDVFNIRISKCGGLINSMAIYHKAIDAGLSCQLGAQVGEMAFLSAAGRHFATRCEEIRWFEGSYGKLLLKSDIGTPCMTISPGGWGGCIDRAGLGVEPIVRRIEKFKIESIDID